MIAGNKWILFGLAIAIAPTVCAAQDLAPRTYLATPVSSNAFNLTYSFSTGELVFDPTLPITDARGTIQTPVVSLYHAFGMFGRSASITGAVPIAFGDLSGSVAGADRSITRGGMADTVVRFAVNLMGGRAMTPAEFVKTPPPRRVLGASLKVTAPTGQYDPTRIINIGTNRWAFKPEVGYTGRVGSFIVDAYAGLWLFTANNSFSATAANPRGSTRRQDPIGAFEVHLSYDVRPRLWISADLNYWRGGRTTVDGLKGELTLQSNSRFGLTGSVPLTRHQSLKVSYSDGVVIRLGGNFKILSAGWQYGWIGWAR